MDINIFNKVIGSFKKFNDLLITLFVFSIVSGLLFGDPFGVIETIAEILSNVNDNGIAGLISLLVVVLWYRRN